MKTLLIIVIILAAIPVLYFAIQFIFFTTKKAKSEGVYIKYIDGRTLQVNNKRITEENWEKASQYGFTDAEVKALNNYIKALKKNVLFVQQK